MIKMALLICISLMSLPTLEFFIETLQFIKKVEKEDRRIAQVSASVSSLANGIENLNMGLNALRVACVGGSFIVGPLARLATRAGGELIALIQNTLQLIAKMILEINFIFYEHHFIEAERSGMSVCKIPKNIYFSENVFEARKKHHGVKIFKESSIFWKYDNPNVRAFL